jgi:hypothetical protein
MNRVVPKHREVVGKPERLHLPIVKGEKDNGTFARHAHHLLKSLIDIDKMVDGKNADDAMDGGVRQGYPLRYAVVPLNAFVECSLPTHHRRRVDGMYMISAVRESPRVIARARADVRDRTAVRTLQQTGKRIHNTRVGQTCRVVRLSDYVVGGNGRVLAAFLREESCKILYWLGSVDGAAVLPSP